MGIISFARSFRTLADNKKINPPERSSVFRGLMDQRANGDMAMTPSEADEYIRKNNPGYELANYKLNEDGKIEPGERYMRRIIKHAQDEGNQYNARAPLQVADLAPRILTRDDWGAYINIADKFHLHYDLSFVFSDLEKRTQKALSKWKFVPHFDGVATGNNAPPATFVNGRFPDVDLVKDTAIPDATRPGALLHANRVDLGAGLKFIASQKPKRNEIPGFWQAVDQQAVPLIVDLTNKNDGRHDKDWRRYVPTLGKVNFNDVCITKQPLERDQPEAEFVKRNIWQQKLLVQTQGAEHGVQRINFHQWPDHGVVEPQELIELADLIQATAKDKEGPIWIHCRAGVGRTGTLMSFMAAREILIKHLQSSELKNFSVNKLLETVVDVVAKGRMQRGPHFVQTKEQFALVVEALMQHFDEALQAPPINRNNTPSSPVPSQPNQRLANLSGAQGSPAASVQHFRNSRLQEPVVPVEPQTAPSEDIANQATVKRGNLSPLENKIPASLSAAEKQSPPTVSQDAPDKAKRKAPIPWGFLRGGLFRNPLPTIAEVDEGKLSNSSEKPALSQPAPTPQPAAAKPTLVNNPPATLSTTTLWETLGAKTQENPIEFLPTGEVDDNGSGVPCPKQTVVEVDIPGNTIKPHANHVRFKDSAQSAQHATQENVFIAAQAPHGFEACERLLFKGIQSGTGIFQIVTPQAHQALLNPELASHLQYPINSIIDQLHAQRLHSKSQAPIVLGGRYQVQALEPLRMGQASSTYLLTVIDLQDASKPITVPLTQAGLKFDGQVVIESEIVLAHSALQAHLDLGTRNGASANNGPILVSPAGVGRNATLMVYSHIKAKIDSGVIRSKQDLDQALVHEITLGRQARGPMFVHSPAQLKTLRSALRALLNS